MQFRNVIAMSVVGACCAGLVFAQEKSPATSRPLQVAQKTKEKAAKADKTDAKKTSTRLPNNYGKLGLNEVQKERVQTVMGTYNAQIDVHEEQIKTLKAKRDMEAHAVLTADQKEKLASLEMEAKKKKTEKSDKDKKETESAEEKE